MSVIRKNYIQPSPNINDKNCEISQDGNVLFSFSSILSAKYSKGRVASSIIQQESARTTPLSSNVIDSKNNIQPSTNNNGKNSELLQDGTSLVSFSSILSAKYSKDRMASSVIPQKSARTATLSSTIIDIEQSHQSFSQLVQTIPESEHTHKRKPAIVQSFVRQ